MAGKKVVLVLVEGPSDDEALSLFLTKIYSESKVHVEITYCDLTTKDRVNMSTILNQVGAVVESVMARNRWKKSDFQQIVHIVDMDGAFVSDDAIVEDLRAKDPFYTVSEIRTCNVNAIKRRNEQKRGCLEKISSTPKVFGIPYQAYYMSCNLDHVLHDKQNSTDEEKGFDSHEFAKRFKDNLEGFKKYICNSDFSVDLDYLSSWAYIKEDKHSLERHTNLCVCLRRACGEMS